MRYRSIQQLHAAGRGDQHRPPRLWGLSRRHRRNGLLVLRSHADDIDYQVLLPQVRRERQGADLLPASAGDAAGLSKPVEQGRAAPVGLAREPRSVALGEPGGERAPDIRGPHGRLPHAGPRAKPADGAADADPGVLPAAAPGLLHPRASVPAARLLGRHCGADLGHLAVPPRLGGCEELTQVSAIGQRRRDPGCHDQLSMRAFFC
mmetsp:Transcript_55061/g.141767  ORF Transcript_55061/g.141767 Transcript_55061/m.141767 type:complete len:206 (-) Transcript_55061:57-674(-)